ncbi:hypothetical protein R76727_04053 [Ralstonia mannitolilytica]|nr:hypothetical protein R76727_04053 [Ralstonia mannitolilytica]
MGQRKPRRGVGHRQAHRRAAGVQGGQPRGARGLSPHVHRRAGQHRTHPGVARGVDLRVAGDTDAQPRAPAGQRRAGGGGVARSLARDRQFRRAHEGGRLAPGADWRAGKRRGLGGGWRAQVGLAWGWQGHPVAGARGDAQSDRAGAHGGGVARLQVLGADQGVLQRSVGRHNRWTGACGRRLPRRVRAGSATARSCDWRVQDRHRLGRQARLGRG